MERGASYLITQLFFDNRAYFDFVAAARAAGVTVPIIPGIIPITSVSQLHGFIARLGVEIPAKLMAAFESRRDSPQAVLELGVAWSTLQCAGAARRRSAGHPLLHHEPLTRDPGDPLGAAGRATLGTPRLSSLESDGAKSRRRGAQLGSVRRRQEVW